VVIAGWTSAAGAVQDLDDADEERALGGLWATIGAHATADGVLYESAAWITHATRL
jgi:hypothetical protein